MAYLRSSDGTQIAYDRQGHGRAVILVTGALDDGSENAPLAAELASTFTVFNYARRGRGASGDTQPYAVQRELEDVDALIAEAGGSASVYGVSSGGMFALEAAAAGLAIDRLAVYEVPYDVADGSAARYEAYRQQLGEVLADGRRGDAVALFMQLAGSPDEEIAGARASPYWPGLEALAHTLAYDAELYGPPPTERLDTIRQPTLVITGADTSFYGPAGDVIAGAVPGAERLILDDQGHLADTKVIAPVLERWVGGA
jgi:pimeloyl-ACP methyl ester carboxylesterase